MEKTKTKKQQTNKKAYKEEKKILKYTAEQICFEVTRCIKACEGIKACRAEGGKYPKRLCKFLKACKGVLQKNTYNNQSRIVLYRIEAVIVELLKEYDEATKTLTGLNLYKVPLVLFTINMRPYLTRLKYIIAITHVHNKAETTNPVSGAEA